MPAEGDWRGPVSDHKTVSRNPLSNGQPYSARHLKSRRVRPSSSLAIRDLQPPRVSARYRALVEKVEERESAASGGRREHVRGEPVRLKEAREAVLLRCQGQCENPSCGGQPSDLTDHGQAILEVDHVERIAGGGRDHPVQMVALCPNCHAMKERGAHRAALQSVLLHVAKETHLRWNAGDAG
ncbi:HNH endonuclease [Streptomyces sp. NBC_01794]|uniref:HNH endonuclease n=1 Tax=Streptomyces sp. NBC_01794 TaxID=2975942 RepID=UPI0038738D99